MKTKKTILLFFVLLASIGLNAQNLVVTLTNSNVETFAVSDIQSIKFEQGTMILNEFDGTVNNWNVDDIDNYEFNGTVNISENESITTSELNIFPNPTTNNVTVNFTSNAKSSISIAVY